MLVCVGRVLTDCMEIQKNVIWVLFQLMQRSLVFPVCDIIVLASASSSEEKFPLSAKKINR